MSKNNVKHLLHPKYRPDIDGLRAVAVLSVVIFHAFPSWLTGGFIGVDVFFVISGFLISTIIFQSLDGGVFGFGDFYARRIKRIFPALFIVLLCSCVFGWFALLSDEYRQLGQHMAAGAGFVSNFVLWREAGYFDNSAESKPLLHLWSLGIEEQFYMVWPLVLWLAWKRGFSLILIIGLIAAVSFWLNLEGVKKDAVAAFYSPQTRFWELLVGSALAWFLLYRKEYFDGGRSKVDGWLATAGLGRFVGAVGGALSNFMAFAGCLLLLYGFWRINKTLSFPGKWALIPVVGATLIIMAGPEAWINRKILANRVAVWFGLISFPLYLWHWPLLSFARIVEGGMPGSSVRVMAVAMSVVLAWLTYALVERRIRLRQHGKSMTVVLVLLMVVVGAIGYSIHVQHGLAFRMKDRESFVEYFDDALPGLKFSTNNKIFSAYRSDCDFYDGAAHRRGRATRVPVAEISHSCYVADASKSKRVFLWGDSHAQHLYHGLSNGLPGHWQILLGVASGCSPSIVNVDSEDDYCRRSNFFALSTIASVRPDVVVVARNSDYDIKNSLAMNARLKELGVAKVIFTGPVPHWKSDLPKIIARKLWVHTPERTFVGLDTDLMAMNSSLREQYASNGLQYVDVMSVFCDQDGCLTRIGGDRMRGITTRDYGHLLPIASDYLAKHLLVQKIVDR